MPTRPMSHEARQRHARAQSPLVQAQRQAMHHDYAERRRAEHGPDPRSTARWQRLRLMVLARQPVCLDPWGIHKGEPVPATEVDHIVGVWQDLSKVYDMDNCAAYCHQCHARKSGMERRIDKA